MSKTIIKSYGKLNLFLNIGKKNKKNKLHNVQSLVCLMNLFDEIAIKRINAKKDKVKFNGKFCSYIDRNYNTVSSCLSLLRKKKVIKKNYNYNISIKKNIPVFSGLGGGSSNAATIVKYFVKRKLTKKEKIFFSQKIGSDLRLFFDSKQVFQKNLSQIFNLKKKIKFYFILVYPFLKSSTKEVYSKVTEYKKLDNYNFYDKSSNFRIIEYLKHQENSLEKIVISRFPIIQKILFELMITKNCEFSRLTGSGSACFGVFLTKKSAVLGLKKIKKKFPKFWCVVGKTI